MEVELKYAVVVDPASVQGAYSVQLNFWKQFAEKEKNSVAKYILQNDCFHFHHHLPVLWKMSTVI